MVALLCFVFAVLASPFKSKIRLEAENTALRHQLIVLRRQMRGWVRLTQNDRLLFVQLYRWFPSILKVLCIIRPETLIGWHRAGFRSYWRWKSRSRGGRPQIEIDLRALIRRMSMENPLWGAPRIHGELLTRAQLLLMSELGWTEEKCETICEALDYGAMQYSGGTVQIETNIHLEELFQIMNTHNFDPFLGNTDSLKINGVKIDMGAFREFVSWYSKCEQLNKKSSGERDLNKGQWL